MADSLQKKTFSGFLWAFLETFALQAFAFVQGIILARLLIPSDYGVVAMTNIFFAVSATLIDSGFSNALIRKKSCTEQDYSTVYVTNIILSCFFATIIALCARLIANFYHEPILTKIVFLNSIMMILGSFITIQGVKLTIELNFKAKSIINATAVISTGIATIILAYMGWGVWSLIYPGFVTILIRGVLYWYYQRWLPSFSFSIQSYKEFFSYGYKLALSSLLNTVYNNIYPLIIGRCFTAADLGYYSKAKGYADLPSTTVSNILGKVTFPILCKIQDEDSRLAIVYRKMLRISAYVVFPIMFSIAALSKPLIEVLITHKWATCIPLLQVLCFALMWYPIHALNLNLLLVKGRSDLFLKLEIAKKVVGVISICITFPFGIFWMCVGQIADSLVCLIINTYYTGKLINVGFFRQMLDIFPTIIYSSIMLISIRFAIVFVQSSSMQIIIGFLTSIITYFTISTISKSEDLKSLLELIKNNTKFNKV